MVSLGRRIAELRVKRGFTQITLAEGLCTPSMISQIESDRARPSYKILFAIAEKLGVTIEYLLSDVELNLETKSQWTMARALVAHKEYKSALPLLQELENNKEQAISEIKLQQHLAECYVHTGQLEEAEQLLEQLRETAVMQGDYYFLTHVLQHRGLLYERRKQYHVAMHIWESALDALDQSPLPDDLLRGALLSLLGQASSQVGQVQRAILFYTEAAACYKNSENLHDLARLYMQMAHACRLLKRYDQSIDYAEQTRSIYQGLDDYLTTLQLKLHTAAVYGQNGREEDALEMISAVIPQFQLLGHNELAGCAHAERAKIHFAKGDLEAAEEDSSLARALLPELHPALADLFCIRGKLAWQRGGVEEAIHQLKKAADIYQNAGMVREWEDTMAETARLCVERRDMDQAYALMEQVRQKTRAVLDDRGIML